MSGAQTLEIKLVARLDEEDALSWLVTIFVDEQASPGPTTLRHPFNEEQRSDCRWYLEESVCKVPYSVTRARPTARTFQQYAKSLLDQLGLVKLVKDGFERANFCGNRSVTIPISEDCGGSVMHSVHQPLWELLEDTSFWDTEIQVTIKRIVISDENGQSAVGHDDLLALPRVNGDERS